MCVPVLVVLYDYFPQKRAARYTFRTLLVAVCNLNARKIVMYGNGVFIGLVPIFCGVFGVDSLIEAVILGTFGVSLPHTVGF